MRVCSVVSDFLPPWTRACQAPLSMGFSRQEYWSGLPCLLSGELPDPRIEPRSPALQADSLLPEPPGKPKNTGVGSLSLLQGIFLTQELNGSPALQADSLPAELPGKHQINYTSNLKKFNTRAVPNYISTNTFQECPFHQIIISIGYYQSFKCFLN